ncbi:MAG: ATP-binding protein [Anaerolineae bacterium]|nr:ATP-binding protein [Anaerolineae bacterium]
MNNKAVIPHIIQAPDVLYLGARVNPETRQVIKGEPVYYDSTDLTTHAVILGATGSGKSGLAIDILEEAAIDGIPQIIIDPKGDITNMLLAFPELSAETLTPWLMPQKREVDSASLHQHAEQAASEWQDNLNAWGITQSRIQAYRQSSKFSILTPGIDAGLQISVLSSFDAPGDGWAGNEDKYRKKLSGIVTALLSLIGIDAEPLEDPEHVLLANIFEYNWSQDFDLTVEHLIHQVQNPPFKKLGVLDVDTVISDSARQSLAQQINNIIAAPTFQSWLSGRPLDISGLLYTDEGYPRVSIFYLAHLNDAERQFFITLLLENMLAWMHTLTGAPKLRALLYIDEVYGLLPPAPYNPPTKDPIMRLLKQARALGVGLIMTTQNAKDIDYKGLSNAGTWFMGKLSTEHDRQRVLEGIEAEDNSEERTLDLAQIRKLLSNLNSREFIRYNTHDAERVMLMKSRQTMSYLRGPLSPAQIRQLMDNQKTQHEISERSKHWTAAKSRARQGEKPKPRTFSGSQIKSNVSEGQTIPLTRSEAPPGFAPVKPSISSAIDQYYLPVEYTPGQAIYNWKRQRGVAADMVEKSGKLLYQPSLLGEVNVQYRLREIDSSRQLWYAFIVPTLPEMAVIDWGRYLDAPFDTDTLSQQPFSDAYYGDISSALHQKSALNELEKRMVDWIYKNLPIYTYYNPDLDIYCGLREDPDDFLARLQAEAREHRDDEIAKVVDKYDRLYDRLERQIQRKTSRLEAEEEELESRKEEAIVSGAESAWRLLKGSVYRTISQIAQLRRRSQQTSEDVEVLQEDLNQLLEEVDETEHEMEADLTAVREKWREVAHHVEELPISPYKKDITTILFGFGWIPYWAIESGGDQLVLPATSSGIVQQQGVVSLPG